ncbi:hypothetical protein AC1031_009974 [Aphanomyces cochlioides]|nr:hypothetical protein AC1031_009974 [Aphanomyces cochlioides]
MLESHQSARTLLGTRRRQAVSHSRLSKDGTPVGALLGSRWRGALRGRWLQAARIRAPEQSLSAAPRKIQPSRWSQAAGLPTDT